MELYVMEPAGIYRLAEKSEVVGAALENISENIKPGTAFDSPGAVRDFLRLTIGSLEREVFSVIFLDSQNCVIDYEEMFRGTLTETRVYTREVVKACINRNAAAVVFAHNHPSGSCVASRADEALTQTLKTALALVDVRVLDHIIVTATEISSMAEKGLF